MAHKQATSNDVAKLAGVSQPTVSRAFDPKSPVSPKTRAKVLAAAEALGYTPDANARSLKSRNSNIVGIIIGPGRPFVIIGERINRTDRKLLGKEMLEGNFERVRQDAVAQVEAGAHMLDVNAGVAMGDEPAILAEAIRIVQSVVDVPLAIDSSVVAALSSGLEAYQGKALVNSVTGESERLERVPPLVAEHGAAVIGVANDETGISHDADVRFAVAKKIVERAESYGIPRDDVVIDPLAVPVGAVHGAAATFIQLKRRIGEELGVNTTCGASNVSFGLPGRPSLNAAFLAMIIGAGMTSAITNPLGAEHDRCQTNRYLRDGYGKG